MEERRRCRRSGGKTDNNDLNDQPDRKRRKANLEETFAEDRFSALPESLILRILSILPIRDVITRTSTLSKRFQHLWTLVPNLIFDPVSSNPNHISFVTKTLSLRRGSKIDRLSLTADEDVNASDVDQWIDFAMTCNVESLELLLEPVLSPEDDYVLPEKLYTSSSLRKLKISWLRVEPIGAVCLKSLNYLAIHLCDYSNDKISQILEGCPVLEFLEIDCVKGVERLVLASKSVKKIRVFCRGDMKVVPMLCMPSLVDARLDFSIEHCDELQCQAMRKLTQDVIDSLSTVENLTLTSWFVQVLSMWRLEAFPSQLVKCKFLTLETGVEEWEFPGIATLLHSVPNLEILDLKYGYVRRHFKSCKFDGNDVESRERFSNCSLDHLKLVRIHLSGPKLYEYDLELIQFVLKKAKVLKKMIIYPRLKLCNNDLSRLGTSKELLQTTTKLLNLPRSSPNAVVTFMCKDSDFT